MLKNVQQLDQRNEILSDIEVQADLLTEETKSFTENEKKLEEQARARNFKYTIILVFGSVITIIAIIMTIRSLLSVSRLLNNENYN